MTFLHDIDPLAVSLPFWPHGIHWYGLMYALAFFVAWRLGRSRVRAGRLPGVNDEGFDDLLACDGHGWGLPTSEFALRR